MTTLTYIKKHCVICLKEIKAKDTYFKIDLFLEGKYEVTDYVHKTCRDSFEINQRKVRNLIEGAQGLLGTANRMGLIDNNKEVYLTP